MTTTTTTDETIRPAQARRYLATRHPDQRRIRPALILAYAADMMNGRWTYTGDPIRFDCAGRLIDGQHRLLALIEASATMRFPVVRGILDEAIANIDSGAVRSVADAIQMGGGERYGVARIATARAFVTAPTFGGFRKLTRAEVARTLDVIRSALDFTARLEKVTGVVKECRALVARAYYHVPESRLAEWCEILRSGVVSDPRKDQAAITYRDLLTRTRLTGYDGALEAYQKGQRALLSFVAGEPNAKLYRTEADHFPIREGLAASLPRPERI